MTRERDEESPSAAKEFAAHANDAFVSLAKALVVAGRGVESSLWGGLRVAARTLRGRGRRREGSDADGGAEVFLVSDDRSRVVGVVVCTGELAEAAEGAAEELGDEERESPAVREIPAEALRSFLRRQRKRARPAVESRRDEPEAVADEIREEPSVAPAPPAVAPLPEPAEREAPLLVGDASARAEESLPEEGSGVSSDIATLLEGHSPDDRAALLKLCVAVDEVPYGGEAARERAREAWAPLGLKAEEVLVEALRRGPTEVAEIALEGLEAIGSERIGRIVAELSDSNAESLRLAALRAAQRMEDDDEARPILERACDDPSARIRRRVVSYLSWRASPWAVEAIRELCDDGDVGVRAAAFEALAVCQPERARTLLEQSPPPITGPQRKRLLAILNERVEGEHAAPAEAPAVMPPADPSSAAGS